MKPFDITLSEDQKTPSEEQVFKRLKELTIEKINAICKEKINKGFTSEVLGSAHAYSLTLEDQANLQALVIAGIDSLFRCAEISNGVIGFKTYKKHTKAQLLKLSQEALKFKSDLILFYGREKERLNAVTSLEALEKFQIKEYLT
ncbi:hypothetical protein [Helicobacter phage COL 5-PUJ]|uniref:hypothetical protein n=1 Tax=Helicobacter pylori TaxID=210 RepID=UPI001931CF85|nr:hypothetical protein [Helicobacter pylori]MBS3010860.1 hypothetical protein [Helicobacter pylori]MBS3016761.1 hypothetical protein [Helicobacter pylori]QQO40048.1 hypothetical protein [Helicobacter phage COL 5-PUJ]QQO40079.1 hypothetical protein [Helicobacter phage COL 6-PUJ]